jgi:hypothetical protein
MKCLEFIAGRTLGFHQNGFSVVFILDEKLMKWILERSVKSTNLNNLRMKVLSLNESQCQRDGVHSDLAHFRTSLDVETYAFSPSADPKV